MKCRGGYLMYNKSMGYIIEKMRGDSLTPLGTGKKVGTDITLCPEFPKILDNYSFGHKFIAMSSIVHCCFDDSRNVTVSYGKWVLIPYNIVMFDGIGFYYMLNFVKDINLYLYGSRSIKDENKIQFSMGCVLVKNIVPMSNTSTTLYDCHGLDSNDEFFKKKFGIKTLHKDYAEFVKK